MKSRFDFFFLYPLIIATFLVTGFARAADQIIQYSNQVPQTEIDLLTEDLNRPLKFTDDAANFKGLMQIKELTFGALKSWLGERVGYIVAESEDPADGLFVLQENYAYQNPTIFPTIEKPSSDGPPRRLGASPEAQRTGAAMINVGTNIYIHGKLNKQLMGYAFQAAPGKINLPIKSPRVGLIQIGESLFQRRMNDETESSYGNSIYRLAYLFHEARHGDGNGKSLGFVHAICPKESPYRNTLSCDREANGPYTVEAQFIRHAVIACHAEKNCDDDETERLSFVADDALDRVLSDVILDPTPEGLSERTVR